MERRYEPLGINMVHRFDINVIHNYDINVVHYLNINVVPYSDNNAELYFTLLTLKRQPNEIKANLTLSSLSLKRHKCQQPTILHTSSGFMLCLHI